MPKTPQWKKKLTRDQIVHVETFSNSASFPEFLRWLKRNGRDGCKICNAIAERLGTKGPRIEGA